MRNIALLVALILFTALPSWADDKGPPISIELRDVEVKDVLRALSQEHGINIIVDDTISGTVTISIKNVPLWDAIESILRSKGYTYRIIKSNLLIIEPLSEHARKQEDVVIGEFKLRYLKVTDKAIESLKSFLSDKGQFIPVESTNSFIVRDIPSVVERIGSLVSNMDIQPAQVMIEAKIVEMRTSLSRELGINWSAQSTDWVVDGNFSVNLPVIPSAGTLGLGYVRDRLRLDAQLSAMEASGEARIVSSPKIRVLENQEAVISSGEERYILIANITTPGEEPPKVEAKLELTVTPRAIADQQVAMTINTKRDEFDDSQKVAGFSPKLTREAKTKLIVKDSDTIVIGGIYKKNEFKGESGVPFLSKIPILGWLFKKKSKVDDQVELLIFITPTIVRDTRLSESQTQ